MADATGKIARLMIDGANEAIELPMYSGSEGPDVIDVGKLTGQGYFTYDPGFVSTASCDSEITYIDGVTPESDDISWWIRSSSSPTTPTTWSCAICC